MPKELVPQDVIKGWVTKCDPKLLLSVEYDYERIREIVSQRVVYEAVTAA